MENRSMSRKTLKDGLNSIKKEGAYASSFACRDRLGVEYTCIKTKTPKGD